MADLTGRALDVAVAKLVMGLNVEWQSGWPPMVITTGEIVPCYSTNYNAVARVRAEIERRGLRGHFVYALAKQLGFSFEIEPFDEIAAWMFLNASPEQQCRAALAAVEGRTK